MNHYLSDNESVHNLVNNSSIFVIEQDTSNAGKTNRGMVQSSVNQTKVVHGTIFTDSDRAGDCTLATEGLTTGYR